MAQNSKQKRKEKDKRARINSRLLTEAVDCHRQGLLDKADSLYNRILLSNPNHLDALHYSGLLAHQRGDYEQAVRFADRAIVLRPENASFHNNRGVSLKLLGRLADAADCYRRTLELEPDNAEAHRNLGNALKDAGNLADALECLRKAKSLNAEYKSAYDAMVKLAARAEDGSAAPRQSLGQEAEANVKSKLCSRCSMEKPTSEFHKNRHTKDGLKAACKACVNSQAREYRQRVKERLQSSS